MKWKLILLMVLLLIPLAAAELIECKGVMNQRDLPCQIISTWQFPRECGTYEIKIFNTTANLARTATMGNYTDTARCNITFGIYPNETTQGNYVLNWSSGDSSKIIIEEDEDMILGIVLGVGIISALLLFFAFKLDDEHIVLKILFMISSITLLILIPASTFITSTANAGKTFYRTFLYIFIAFWLYVFGYFCYWILRKLGWIASGGEND